MLDVWRKATRRDRVTFVAAAVFTLLLVAGLIFRGPTKGVSRRYVSTHGLEADLAAMQLHHRPGRHNPLLKQFSYDLDILEADCPLNTRKQLAALTAEAVKSLARHGVTVTPNAVFGGVVGAPDLGSTERCEAFFARWVASQHAGATLAAPG